MAGPLDRLSDSARSWGVDTKARLLTLGALSARLVAATISFGGGTTVMLIARSVHRPKPARRVSDLFEDSL